VAAASVDTAAVVVAAAVGKLAADRIHDSFHP